eukprot:12415573-Karenia_brevis.AAC.1
MEVHAKGHQGCCTSTLHLGCAWGCNAHIHEEHAEYRRGQCHVGYRNMHLPVHAWQPAVRRPAHTIEC